ncbi:hypothetical protein Moror_4189 [Moniliophthora roreri MCA 2997]|uniref:Zn(2)-C6 fungal-type domain-containing protein n=2 Tax=Moniliophthora roreri TaxID=221103 RepID=V2XDR9_MONRO|nr:hypothetical protein Moror_4189 [Moniliophthora roreri MCA 2997]KAI3597438.1 hypothetical protein WG66_013227 [Moniliophthora roreri]
MAAQMSTTVVPGFNISNAVEGLKARFIQEWSREATEEEASRWNNSVPGKSMTCWTCAQLKVQCTPGSASTLPCARCITQRSENICTRAIEERRDRVKRVMNLDEETFNALRATCHSSPVHQRKTSLSPVQESSSRHRSHSDSISYRSPPSRPNPSEVIDLTVEGPPPSSSYRSVPGAGHPYSCTIADPSHGQRPPPPQSSTSFGVFPVARNQTTPVYRSPPTSATRIRTSPYHSPPIATRAPYTYAPDRRTSVARSPISPPTSAHSGPPPSSSGSTNFSFSYPPPPPPSGSNSTFHSPQKPSDEQNHGQNAIAAVQQQVESLRQVNQILAKRNQEMHAVSEEYARRTKEEPLRTLTSMASGVAIKREDADDTQSHTTSSLQEEIDKSRRLNRRLIQRNSELQREVDELKSARRSGSEGEPSRMLGQMRLSPRTSQGEADVDIWLNYPEDRQRREDEVRNRGGVTISKELKELKDIKEALCDVKAKKDGLAVRLEEEMSENNRLKQLLADQNPSRSAQAQSAIAEHTNLQLLIRTLEQARTKGEISRVCNELRQVAARMLEHVPRGFGWQGIVRVLGHGGGTAEGTMAVNGPAGVTRVYAGGAVEMSGSYGNGGEDDSPTRAKRRRLEGSEGSEL